MALIDYVLGQQSLQQLGPDVQDQARSEGYRRFILGTLLGGKGLASGYAAAQEVIPGIQAAQQQRRVNQAVQNSMVNLGVKPGSQLDLLQSQMGDLEDPTNRTAAALQRNVQQKNAAPGMGGTGLSASQQMLQRFDPTLFAQNIPAVLAGQDQKKALEIAQMGAPKFDENTGIGLDPFSGERTGQSLPRISNNIITQFGEGGTASATPVSGASRAQEAVRPIQLEPGEVIIGYDMQNQPILRNAQGKVYAASERAGAVTSAQESAKAEFDLVESVKPDGSVEMITREEAVRRSRGAGSAGGGTFGAGGGDGGGPVIKQLSEAQQALNQSYKPILESARSGFEVAKKRSGTIEQLRNALNNPNFDTGALTPFKSNMTNILSSFGVTGDRANSYLTSSAAFRQGVNELTMSSLADLVGAISNFEIDFSQKRFGTITDPKQANLYSLDLLEAADKRRREYYDFVTKNPDPLVEQRWAESQAGQRSLFEDPKLRKWLPQATIPSGPDKGKIAYQLPSGKTVVFD
jgi:hypothetical protein